MNVRADKEDKTGKDLSIPRELYIRDKGEGKCRLLLNPNDMQVGANYGDNYWIMGDQFMQKYYTIYDHAGWRMGLVESKNTFSTQAEGPKELGILDKIQKEASDAENAEKKEIKKNASVTANATSLAANATNVTNVTSVAVQKSEPAATEANIFGTQYDDGTSDI